MHFMGSQVCLRFSGVPHVPGVLRWMERLSLRKIKVKRKGIAANVKEQLFCGMGKSVVDSLCVRVRGEASKHDIWQESVTDTLNVSEGADSLP